MARLLPFSFDVSEKLKNKMLLLTSKDKSLALKLDKKIKEVISRNAETIDFYKNLRVPMQDYKRVQVGHFVLIFKVFKKDNFILFDEFDHHDNIYNK